MQPHRSAATVLVALYAALVIYASLYPFTQWRDQGLGVFEFLGAPWPRYWSQFDTFANALGYAPLGFLLALTLLRTTLAPTPWLWATVAASALSLGMEAAQTYLPQRVPALSDWLLNTLGALTGAGMASALDALGVIDQWSRFRKRWFAPAARNSLVLLATWPLALLFPPAVPLGLGQVFERLETTLAEALAGSPFLDWLPVRAVELQPIAPIGVLLCVALGLLAPCLLAYAVVPGWRKRCVALVVVAVLAVLASSLSATLSYGPENAWAWLGAEGKFGLGLGMLAAALCLGLGLGQRACWALLLLALAWQLSLVNLVPSTPYFAQTLQDWEQGRFIRFSGLAQWLGWLWPYAALAVALGKLSVRSEIIYAEPKTRASR